MRRRFRCSSADGCERDQVGDVLRSNRFQHLRSGRETNLIDVEKNSTSLAKTGRDVECIVQMRIVDQPLPSDRCSRLLEIDSHDDEDLAADFVGQSLQTTGILKCHRWIVDRAWSDDRNNAFVIAAKNVFDDAA